MKLIAIGDTHGKNYWKQMVNDNPNADKIVFIGDYFDSFDIDNNAQLENFADIIQFKKDNMNKVILLIGNHDFHYISNINERYSGFQNGYSYIINEIIMSNLPLLQMCYKQDNFLFTHAGVTKTWLKECNYNNEPIDEFINDLFTFTPNKFKFNGRDPYGDNVTQSPIWVRPNSLNKDCVDGFTQIIGHTRQDSLELDEQHIFIDVLDSSKEYLIIQDNQLNKGKL